MNTGSRLKVSRLLPAVTQDVLGHDTAGLQATASVATCVVSVITVNSRGNLLTEGAEVPEMPVVSGRVERELYDAARRAAGLPENAPKGQVIRYALAALAGDPDPRATAHVQNGGYRPRRQVAT